MNEKKVKIEKLYRKKINDLFNYNRLYFIENKPGITDAEYDDFKNELLDLEKNILFKKNWFSKKNYWITSIKKFEK